MKLLAEITDKDFDPNFKPDKSRSYEFRRAARAVIFNEEGEVGIVHAGKENYCKIPGGGIDAGEDNITALKREVMEESGCECVNFRELGAIIDQRNILDEKYGFVQLSYCYTANLKKQSKLGYTEREKKAGFKFHWMKPEEALEAFSSEPEEYHARFMQKRDGIFVAEAQKNRHQIRNSKY